MPAYNAARTLERTLREISRQVVDHIILVDDASHDTTVADARSDCLHRPGGGRISHRRARDEGRERPVHLGRTDKEIRPYARAHRVRLPRGPLLLARDLAGAGARLPDLRPLGNGANIIGTSGWQINYKIISFAAIWYVQVAALLAGHVGGLALAHDRALAIYEDPVEAVRSQYWMLGVMVAFTSFGLWLLSAVGT